MMNKWLMPLDFFRSLDYRLIILAVTAMALLTLMACGGSQTTPTATPPPPPDKLEGTLTGTVTIGPLCPVEPCLGPVDDVYTSRELLLQQDGSEPIRVPFQPDGTFRAVVPAGSYMVELTDCEFLGCRDALPVPVEIRDGETATLNIDIDTGIRSPVGGGSQTFQQLLQMLSAAGALVEAGDPVTQPFFSAPGRSMIVNGEDVQVFEYQSVEEADHDAAQVAPDGGSVGPTMIMWVAPPHFYKLGALIVLYVGDDTAVLTLLEAAIGFLFAGVGEAAPVARKWTVRGLPGAVVVLKLPVLASQVSPGA